MLWANVGGAIRRLNQEGVWRIVARLFELHLLDRPSAKTRMNTMNDCDDPPPPLPVNYSKSTVVVVQHIIYTTIMPTVCTIGVFAASICVIIFTRPQMRSSLNIYLAGLSLFDLILLLISLFIYPPMDICVQNNVSSLSRLLFLFCALSFMNSQQSVAYEREICYHFLARICNEHFHFYR